VFAGVGSPNGNRHARFYVVGLLAVENLLYFGEQTLLTVVALSGSVFGLDAV
jgi:hypothetical protein